MDILRTFARALSMSAALWVASDADADTIAYYAPAGTNGGASFNFVGGMRFEVNSPIHVTQLGMFDDPTNGPGFNSQPAGTPIKVSIWDRDTETVLTQMLFGGGAGDGDLRAGTASRFKTLSIPLQLNPNTNGYIITNDYNFEQYGRTPDPDFKTWSFNDGGGLIHFHNPGTFADSPNQYAVAHDVFPTANDTATFRDRYAAATFQFASVPPPPPNSDTIAYYVPSFTDGTPTYNFVSGMRFKVNLPIVVTELGMFDDPTNGPGFNSQPDGTPIKVSIWDRDTQTVVAQLLFGSGTGDGTLATGSASRFKPLDSPLVLNPNTDGYIITNDYNFEQYGRTLDNLKTWSVNDGEGRITFHPAGTFSDSPNQYEVAHDVFPTLNDNEAHSDRYAAATFKFHAVPEPTGLLMAIVGLIGSFLVSGSRTRSHGMVHKLF